MATNPLRRAAIAVGVTTLAMAGVTGAVIATRPASTVTPQTEVQLVQPAGDEVTTTTTPSDAGDRAEAAADRAETAATHAQQAATHVDQVAATITTTTTTTKGAVPVTVTTQPTATAPTVETTVTTAAPTTTTTPAPKQWVVVARFPVSNARSSDAPTAIPVDLQTGTLRVTAIQDHEDWKGMVWFGDTASDRGTPGQGSCPPTSENRGTIIDGPATTPDCIWRGAWPTGQHIIVAGRFDTGSSGVYNPATDTFDGYRPGGWFAPWSQVGGEIVVEEYR